MGILVQNQANGKFKFYLKGADSVMIPKLNNNERIFVNEETEMLSRQGRPSNGRSADTRGDFEDDVQGAGPRV